MREGSYKMVKWALGAYNAVVTRLRRSLTPEFISTPSDNAGDVQSGIGGVPAGRVAWPVGTASHDGASFVGCDAFPAKYVHKEKKVYLLDTLGKRHYGAKPLEVGKNVELAGGVESDSDGVVVRGAEFGDAQKVVGGPKLANNIFYPAGSKLIAHHLQPDPPTQSSQVYDVDGRKGGLHYPLRVREWLVKFGTGLLGAKQAAGFLPKIFAPLFNFTENGDGTPAHGAAHFADSEAVLSAERGGPLRPADDGNHELGKTNEAKVNQGANDIDVLYGPIRALYGPEELVDEQWENGSKGPYIKRVEKRPDFTDRHPNAFGVQVPMKIKWQTWDSWNTYPTIPPPPEAPPPDKPPVPPTAPPPVDVPPRDVFPKPMPNPVPGFPGQGAATRPEYGNAPPVTSTPNEVGVPSEYGEPVPGTPEPRVPVPSGISRFMEGHNFTEEERVKQGRVGHSVYAPVYKSNTAGAGSTAAQRWPVSYTSEGKLYVAANGRVLAIERPYYASGAKITLAPEMERQHQFVANKETWPTTLSAFYTIFGAGKNVAGTEFIGGFGMGLRVPNSYLPASGFAVKLVYTDSTTLPHIDIITTDANGLADAGAGSQQLRFNGTQIATGSSANNVTAASTLAADSRVPVATGNTRAVAASDFSMTRDGTKTLNTHDGSAMTITPAATFSSTLASGAHTTTLAGGGKVSLYVDDGTNGADDYIEEDSTADATAKTILTIPIPTNSRLSVDVQLTAILSADVTKSCTVKALVSVYNNAGTVGTPLQTDIVVQDDSGVLGAPLSATTSTKNLLLQVTGVAATTIRWGIVARSSWRNTTA